MIVKRNVQYMTIADALRDQIMEQRLAEGTPVKSCREIASEHGVSLKTARSAVLELVKENMLYMEQGRGTFVRHSSGQERELQIGCTVSSQFGGSERMQNGFTVFSRGCDAVDYLKQHNCAIRHIPNTVVHDLDELKKYIGELDGLLISALNVPVEQCRDISRLNIPAVIFQGECEHRLPLSQVVPDHYIAYRQFFEQALPEKYDRILIVYECYANHHARRAAFADCAIEAGFKPEQVESFQTSVAECYSLGLKISGNLRKTLVFSVSRQLSAPLCKAFADKGIALGEDIHLLGYDDMEDDDSAEPVKGISAIEYSHHKVSVVAAEMLMEEIREKRDFTQIIKIPTTLILRESTGKPA